MNDYYKPNAGLYSARRTPKLESRYREVVTSNLAAVDGICSLKGARLLDVGCGEGILLEVAREMGADVIGIEPSPLETDRLKAKGFKVHCGLLSDVSLEAIGGPVDIVSLTWVLDCFSDPLSALRQLRTFIKDDGILHITQGSVYGAPLVRWRRAIPIPYQKPLKAMKPDRLTPDIHPFYFTHHTLISLLKVAGFMPLEELAPSTLQPVINAKLSAAMSWQETVNENPARLIRYFRNWSIRDKYYVPIFGRVLSFINMLRGKREG
ncbi:MAG: class I SAM-dependent methyltransferase [Fimbriimonadaceae bacterium]|nr:class I SAM-dependent methyltransferase [Alphaproteobacteria bacterium]